VIVSKTPLRISFAGGGTDLPSFYRHNKFGAVLSTSIDSYIYISIKTHTPLFEERIRLNYSDTELVNDVGSIRNSIIRECLKFLEIDDRIYISTIADAPPSAGLGSSSTFTVGLLNALYKYKGVSVSRGTLAEEAAHIEIEILKRPMGKQDHYAAAYGGINYIRFYDDETVTVRPLNMTSKNLQKFSDSIAVFWTGLTRPSESVLKEQDENNKSNEDVLKKMKDQAQDLSRILTETELSVKNVGDMLNQGWRYKKTLASTITNQLIDDWYAKALKHGALGGKISGAGGGGFLTLIVEPSKHNELVHDLEKNGLQNHRFGFDSNGTIVDEII